MHSINYYDPVKHKVYSDGLYHAYVYATPESSADKGVTDTVYSEIFKPLGRPTDSKILDFGCGRGYFMDNLKADGYSTYLGITLCEQDLEYCRGKGHPVLEADVNFLKIRSGFLDGSADFIFNRNVLQDNPAPLYGLYECNRLLVRGGLMYIEIPCWRSGALTTLNYLDDNGLCGLLQLAGFTVLQSKVYNIDSSTKPIKFYGYTVFKSHSLNMK